jgi:hypothetical protein
MSIIGRLKQTIKQTVDTNIKDLKVSDDARTARLDTCRSCEHYLSSTTQCHKCKCFMPFKTWLKISKCPINKW